jgi:hypothetical protein
MFVVGIVLPFMVEGMSVPLLFFIFGAITFCHALFVIFFIRETANLTDKEKKALYSPKNISD